MATFNSGVYYTFSDAYNDIVNTISYTTLINSKQISDCLDALSTIPDSVKYSITPTSESFEYTGKFGFKCVVSYEFDRYSRYSFISLDINEAAAPGTTTSTTTSTSTTDTTSTTSSTSTTLHPTTPAPSLSPPTADNKYFKYVTGVSLVSGNSPGDFNIVGATTVFATGQYLKASVTKLGGGVIPNRTVATLYYGASALVSNYSVGDVSEITLYYNLPYDMSVTCVVQTTDTNDVWVAYTTLSANGNTRFQAGSNRGFVYGPQAANTLNGYSVALFAGGNIPGTYIRTAEFLESNTLTYLLSSAHFAFNVDGVSVENPAHGILKTNNLLQLNGVASGQSVYDTILQFSVVEPLNQTQNIPLKLYTPYTFALTNKPVWVQTVFTQLASAITKYAINWGDSSNTFTYDAVSGVNAYFTHAYSHSRNTPYTVSVSSLIGTTVQAVATLSAQFYVQDTFPVIDLDTYSKTLGINLNLPYTKSQIEVGSNEWAVADNINAVFNKFDANFNYLNTISKTIKKTPAFQIVQWLGDLIQYPTWNTLLSGSNEFNSLSSVYSGVVPGNIIDFKSYKSTSSAPDFYNYITYSTGQQTGTIQVRKNDFNNTQVLLLSSVVPGVVDFNAYSVDVSGTSLYLLASNVLSDRAATLYRFNLDYQTGDVSVINQIGGAPGSRNDETKFGIDPFPNELKVNNNKVYVGDKSNGCIKVYNSALTYYSTIYNNSLSGYNVHTFDLNRSTENVYLLGKIKKPNVPVLTSVTTSVSSGDAASGLTEYFITWNHDGENLTVYEQSSASSYPNFRIEGKLEGATGYSPIDAVYSDFNALADLPVKLTTYIFTTPNVYTEFRVQAIGFYSTPTAPYYDSEWSSSIVVPNKNVFPSPYTVFVFDKKSNLLNTITIPQVPSNAVIKKLLIEPTNTFFYVVTDTYIYKYTITGIFVNRINSPSATDDSIGGFEPIVTAFIDENYYFYVVTTTRIFKFIDLPETSQLFDSELVSSYYTPASSYKIGENELVQDWVYNRSLNQLINNHEILAKSINGKYVITVDSENNLLAFNTRGLSANDTIDSLSATESSFIHSNEIVSSAVVNRVVDRVYNIQTAILNLLKPEVKVILPSYTSNILGLVTSSVGNVIYQYIQPAPIWTVQPSSQNATVGDTVIFTAQASSASVSGVSYQWSHNGNVIQNATSYYYEVSSSTLADGGYYSVDATDLALAAQGRGDSTINSDAALLSVVPQTLFSFASADWIGNLYSNLYNGNARYGNDYSASFNVINADLNANLIIELQETRGATLYKFAEPIYVTVTQDNNVIYTATTNLSAVYTIPLSGTFSTASDSIAADGIPGTYGSSFNVKLSVGANNISSVLAPRLSIKPSTGRMYNATFKNSLLNTASVHYNVSTLTVQDVSGTIPFAYVANNSLGGYIARNPYVDHEWMIDSTLSATNPKLDFIPVSTVSSTLSAQRITTPGETEVVMGYNRDSVAAPEVPFYSVTGQPISIAGGNGFLTDTGVLKAGTFVTVRLVGSYINPIYPPARTAGSPLIVEGLGCWDAGTYTSNGGVVNIRQDTSATPSTGGVTLVDIFVDGNKTLKAYFRGNY